MPERQGILEFFAQHEVASRLMMLFLVMAGVWAIHTLNTQVDPDEPIPWIQVDAVWSGAGAEDLERLVTTPIENEVRNATQRVRTISVTREGSALVQLEFEKGADLGIALDEVKQLVAGIRDLPPDLEQIAVRPIQRKPDVASILVTGSATLDTLVPLVRGFERELRALGVDEIRFEGLPREEIAIEVPSIRLRELGVGVDEIGRRLETLSRDVPAGTIGRGQVARKLRSLERRQDVEGFRWLPLPTGADGSPVLLGEVAHIVQRPREDSVRVTHGGRPAIEMLVRRTADTDLFAVSRLVETWVAEKRPTLPPGVELHLYKESRRFLQDLIDIIWRNGLGGLALVIGVLYLFLSWRVATWVMIGIPVSFMGAIALFQLLGGGSINAVMLLALVMTFGIVVDDAIVVGEDAYAQRRAGAGPLEAAVGGARRMFGPVMASSITTMAAFLPLLIIGDEVINIIPLTLVCVILASLVECFLILPGHLRHSFAAVTRASTRSFHERFDAAFARFREERFRPALRWALAHRGPTLALALSAFAAALALLGSGHLGMNLSLGLRTESVEANVQFSPDASAAQREALLLELENSLLRSDATFPTSGISAWVTKHHTARFNDERVQGEQYGAVVAELISPDEREYSNLEIARLWRESAPDVPQLERLHIEALGGRNMGGPDLTLWLSGARVEELKAGAEELADVLARYPGVTNVSDNLPYGDEQWIVSLTTEGRALGLSVDAIGRQLRTAYDGHRVQILTHDGAPLEVRVMLAAEERKDLASLARFPVVTADGEIVPLASVAQVHGRRGIDVIRHFNGRNTVSVSASVDPTVTTAGRILGDIQRAELPDILERHGLAFGLGGRSAEEAELLATLGLGAVLGLILIYAVLAWIFGSYVWPLAIMSTIPLGLTGALVGHWLMGRHISGMSILGIFTLTGVVVNDSIVLVTFYKQLRAEGLSVTESITEATCRRLRAVVVTSLTTVIGLTPLMFEPSPIATYLTPLATSIVWGMAYATLLVVFVIPSLLSVIESMRGRALELAGRLRALPWRRPALVQEVPPA